MESHSWCNFWSLILMFVYAIPAISQENERKHLLSFSDTYIPTVGHGYDSVKGTELQESILKSVKKDTPNLGVESQATVTLYVIDKKETGTSDTSFEASASFKSIACATANTSEYSKVFEQHTLFVLEAKVLKRSEILVTKDPDFAINLKDFEGRAKSRGFYRTYGERIISRVQYGGYLQVVYAFQTTDAEKKAEHSSVDQCCIRKLGRKGIAQARTRKEKCIDNVEL